MGWGEGRDLRWGSRSQILARTVWWSVLRVAQGSSGGSLPVGEARALWCLLLPRGCDNPFSLINRVFLVDPCEPAHSVTGTGGLPCAFQLCGCPLRRSLKTPCGHREEGPGRSLPGCSSGLCVCQDPPWPSSCECDPLCVCVGALAAVPFAPTPCAPGMGPDGCRPGASRSF